jgi:hypothetical protein
MAALLMRRFLLSSRFDRDALIAYALLLSTWW